jgi:large subunit ribosomal protein L23
MREANEANRWSKDTYWGARNVNKEAQELMKPTADTMPRKDRQSIAEQAKRLLEGKEKWMPQWQIDKGGNNKADWLVQPRGGQQS